MPPPWRGLGSVSRPAFPFALARRQKSKKTSRKIIFSRATRLTKGFYKRFAVKKLLKICAVVPGNRCLVINCSVLSCAQKKISIVSNKLALWRFFSFAQPLDIGVVIEAPFDTKFETRLPTMQLTYAHQHSPLSERMGSKILGGAARHIRAFGQFSAEQPHLHGAYLQRRLLEGRDATDFRRTL